MSVSYLLLNKNREECGGIVGHEIGRTPSRWSSLRRLTLERLVPARRAWSGEELRATESEARPLPLPRGGPSRPFLPHYESTGSCCLCPQTTELWKKGLNQPAPSVFSPTPGPGKRRVKPSNHQSPHFIQSFFFFCPICRPITKEAVKKCNRQFIHQGQHLSASLSCTFTRTKPSEG